MKSLIYPLIITLMACLLLKCNELEQLHENTSPEPDACFEIESISNDTIAPATVCFSASCSEHYSKLRWDFDGDGSIDSNSGEDCFTFESSGSFIVTLEVENANGQTHEETKVITINPPPQAEIITFENIFGVGNGLVESGYKVLLTNDEGYIVTGSQEGRGYLLKLDKDGNIETQNTINNSSASIGALQDALPISENEFIAVASANCSGFGCSNTYAIIFDANIKTIKEEVFDIGGRSPNITSVNDNSYLVNIDVYTHHSTIKLRSDLIIENQVSEFSASEQNYEFTSAIITDGTGGAVCVGYSDEDFKFEQSPLLIYRINDNGNLISSSVKEFQLNGAVTLGYDVIAIEEGGYAVTGDLKGQLFVAILNNNFELTDQYIDSRGGLAGQAIIQSSDKGFIITGSYGDGEEEEDLYLLKLDRNLNYLWGHSYGGPLVDRGADVKETPDGGFIITGFANRPFGLYLPDLTQDLFVVKTNSKGEVQ